MNNYKHEFVVNDGMDFAVVVNGQSAILFKDESGAVNYTKILEAGTYEIQSRYTEQHANCWQNLNTLAKPECTGEGLPKVGVECEFSSVGHHEGFVWGKYHGKLVNGEGLIIEFRSNSNSDATIVTSFNPDVTEFRPAQTDKQRIVAKAEKLIKQPHWAPREVLEDLYDAGMLTEPKGEEL